MKSKQEQREKIQLCRFCGYKIEEQIEKCPTCGEFLKIESKRLWFNISPNWISAIAGLLAAILAIFGLMEVKNLLKEARVNAIENHLTWIEVTPVAFLSSGQKDPKDATSTFWYLEVLVQNLGKKTAYVYLKDWTFESKGRGKITKEAYEPKERKFSLQSGQRATWRISFVMSSEYHIPPIMSGEDALNINVKFISKDMLNKELCNYDAKWTYTKDEFTLLEDNRQYKKYAVQNFENSGF